MAAIKGSGKTILEVNISETIKLNIGGMTFGLPVCLGKPRGNIVTVMTILLVTDKTGKHDNHTL